LAETIPRYGEKAIPDLSKNYQEIIPERGYNDNIFWKGAGIWIIIQK